MFKIILTVGQSPLPYSTYMFSRCCDTLVSWRYLVEQMDVSNGVFDITGEVGDLSTTCGVGEMVVDPADENLLGRQFHKIVQRLSFPEKGGQTWVVV